MSKMLPNFTQIPNEILDFAMPDLSESEIKCLMYVCRRTYGFQKRKDKISVGQLESGITTSSGKVLDRGTGLSNKSIIDAMRELEKKNLVIIKRKPGYPSEIEINEKYTYVKSTYPEMQEISKNDDLWGVKSTQVGVKNLHTQKKVSKESLSTNVDSGQSPPLFSLEEEIKKWENSKQRHVEIIGWFMKMKLQGIKKKILNMEQFNIFTKRHMKVAKELSAYTDEQLLLASKYVEKNHSDIEWTLETILKHLTK